VWPDQVRDPFVDRVGFHALRQAIAAAVSRTQDRRAELTPRGGEEDRDGKAEPLEVAVEVGEECLLLAGGQEWIEEDDRVRRLVVDAACLRRRPAPEPLR
jgi:hypothetical protein